MAELPSTLPTTLAAITPWLLERQQELVAWQAASPWLFGSGFFVAFALLAALTLPGCSVLGLAAGLCFGAWVGTVVVSAASTAGAALSFLAARHALRERLMARHGEPLSRVQRLLARDGPLVLLSLRLVPVVPFPLVNPLMGLTQMPLRQFAVWSFVGMLPGSALYAVAGRELSAWAAGGPPISATAWVLLVALALLPWVVRAAWPGERAR